MQEQPGVQLPKVACASLFIHLFENETQSLLGPLCPTKAPTPKPTAAPTPPTPSPILSGNGATCWSTGDPHYKSFDGSRYDFYGSGEFWLLRSGKIQIQTRTEKVSVRTWVSFNSALALSGTLLKGHKLELSVSNKKL